MKRINVIYVLAVVLILEILLSTMAYDEPSFMTNDEERFDVSKITQNQAINVVGEMWTFNSSANYVEISMGKALVYERSIYDLAIPVNIPLVGGPILHARLFSSDLNVSEDLIRTFVVLANETHFIEMNYLIGRELEDVNPDPDAPSYLYLYSPVSNVSNSWVTINRCVVNDIAAKNVTIKTDGSWRILKFGIGSILYPKNQSAAVSILVDLDKTYLDFEGVKIYPDNASENTFIILLIAGLIVFSCVVLVVEGLRFQRMNGGMTKTRARKGHAFEIASLIFILQVALLIRLVFLDSGQLASDEAIYTYTSYLITKGVVPYREVFMAHPPLSFYTIAFFMWISEPSYPSVRILNIGIFLGTIIVTYLLAKVVLGELNGKYSLFVAALYALYPSWFTLNSISSSLENLLTLFILSSTFFYVLHHRKRKNQYLLMSGFLAACALLTTLRVVFFLMSLVIIHLVYLVWMRKPNQFFRNGLVFASGFAFPIGGVLSFLAVSNVLRYFLLDVVTYPLSMFRISMNDRMLYLGQYLAGEWPLLLLTGFGISLVANTVKQSRNISVAIPEFVFFLNFFFFFIFGFLKHYLQFLSPFLAVISILGIIELKKIIVGDMHARARSKVFVCIFLVVLGFFGYLTTTNFYQTSFYFYKNPYDKVNYYIGKRIANITSPSDYIWSGDAAIGFFSKRMIVAPSADFRFIGISDSIIGFDYGNDRGAEMKGYNDGFVTAEDFIQSWESNRVEVLVFIMEKGWVPYVDPLLWNGYREHTGISEYVSREYELHEVVFGEDVPHIYYIWVRRQ